MKKSGLLIISAILIIGLINCKGKDDPMLLLPMNGDKQANQQTPADVPDVDLQKVEPPATEGSGELVAVVGESATPKDESVGGDEKTGDDDKAGDDKSGDHKSKAGDDKTGDHKSKAGDDKAGDHKSKAGDDKAGDHKSKSGDDKSGDHKSKTGDDKAGDHKSKAGDDGEGKKSLVRHGKDACYLDGKWYKDANTIFTYQENKSAGFCFTEVPSGVYEIQVMGRHWVKHGRAGALPEGFSEYKLMIAADGVAGEMQLPASSTGYEKGTGQLDLTGGDISLFLAWTNAYCKGKDCVNLQIQSVKLHRVGDSSRSAVAAYLQSVSTGGYLLLLAVLVIGFAGIVIISRMKKRAGQTNKS